MPVALASALVKAPRTGAAERAGTYLVERYLAATPAGELLDSVTRVAAACGDSGDGEQQVHYLQSTYLPSEDTCFCVFQAASQEAVRAVNATAGFAVDRITTAVVLRSSGPADGPQPEDPGISQGEQR